MRQVLVMSVLITALLAGVPAARAAGGDEDDEPTAGRVTTAIFIVSDDKLSAAGRASLIRGLEKGLKQHDRIVVKETDLLLAEFSGEVPHDAIAEARALAEAGARLFDEGSHEGAARKLESAEVALEGVIAFVKKSELAEVQFLLGAAYLAHGDKEDADAAFARLQVWRPSYVVDVEKHPKVLPAWEKVRAQLEASGRGSVELKSDPPGAMAFVDGKYVGTTPTRGEALGVGTHYVTLKREGYQRRVVKIVVDGKREETITEKLPRSEKYLLLSQSLDRAKPDLGKKDATQAMQDLRTFLFIDQAIFVKATQQGKRMSVEAYLYDLRSKRRLKEVKNGKVPVDGGGDVYKELAGALYSGVRFDGRTDEDDRLAQQAKRGPRRKTKTGITGTWWFWTIVGVGVGAAVPLVLYEAGAFDASGRAACPDGEVCGTVLIRY